MQSKIVVTGVSSFIGCHLARYFWESGAEVTAVTSRDRTCYEGIRAERLKWVPRDCGEVVLDLREETGVRRFIRETRPDVWVHHAGYAKNYASLNYDLEEGHSTNVLPLRYIYEELANGGCRGVILTGSCTEYSDTDRPCKETDFCAPSTPYGLSKLTETLRACQLSMRLGVPTRVARCFIPFGPLDAPGKLIYYVMENLKQGQEVDLSPCTQKRDFLYIVDVLEAYRRLVSDLERGGWGIFNICSGIPTPVREIVERIADGLGAPRDLLKFGAKAMREGETPVSYGSCEKARCLLNWEPSSLGGAVEKLLNHWSRV